MEKFLTFSFNDAHISTEEGSGDIARGEQALGELGEVLRSGGYDDPASSINLSHDEELFGKTKKIAEQIRGDSLAHVLLIGIGGSNLGAEAIYEALRMLPEYKLKPQIHFADTVSPLGMENLASGLLEKISRKEEIAIVVISKSGTTTETAANTAYFLSQFEEKFGDMNDRIAAVTDPGSALDHLALSRGWGVVHIPAFVGGRYSVFSPVGMLPLLLAGLPVGELREGARLATKELLGGEARQSGAASFAYAIVSYSRAGIRTHNMFLFEPALESAGKWWRQLVGESLGKEKNTNGNEVHEGVLPVVSIGSTDLHSVGQLYLGGPRSIVTTFVTIGRDGARVPVESGTDTLVPGLSGKSFGEIMDAIAEGTKRAYRAQGLPFMSIRMLTLSPQALGAFMQTQMIATMIAGRMLEVDPFNQPSVERYKEETRQILHGE